jgi:hypothetical protein
MRIHADPDPKHCGSVVDPDPELEIIDPDLVPELGSNLIKKYFLKLLI